MPYARKDLLTWQKGMYYHFYNRGVSKSILFRGSKNYLFTISKIKEYSQANQINMIAYTLMPTHYHFLVRQDGEAPAGNLPKLVFNSYSKAYNKCMDTAARFLKGGFGRSLFKLKATYCSSAGISMVIPSKTD